MSLLLPTGNFEGGGVVNISIIFLQTNKENFKNNFAAA